MVNLIRHVRIKWKNVPNLAVLSLLVFFLLSLCFHNHGFSFDSYSISKVSRAIPSRLIESDGPCPACTFCGDIDIDVPNSVDLPGYGSFRTGTAPLITDVSGPYSFLSSKISDRSPPLSI